MLSLANGHDDCGLLRRIFVRALSDYIRQTLSTVEDKGLRELAEQADRIFLERPAFVGNVQDNAPSVEAIRFTKQPQRQNRSANKICRNHFRYGLNARSCTPPCMFQSLNAPTPSGNSFSNRRRVFLVDTGAQRSVIPVSQMDRHVFEQKDELAAANGTKSSIAFCVSTVCWNFIIADVANAILGADFLRHYAMMVDLVNEQLVDQNHFTSIPCSSQIMPSTSLYTMIPHFNNSLLYPITQRWIFVCSLFPVRQCFLLVTFPKDKQDLYFQIHSVDPLSIASIAYHIQG
eukprot:TCALIF_13916-PA protein Name:"Protein of unknown function" AED:0.28 eAED:0.54 QI:29/0/0/1/0/0/4/0/288